QDILDGRLDVEFPLDVFQAGAGTSEHMNVNEVIANRALAYLRKPKGEYTLIHPNDHVNLCQSTNDVFHSAIHIAAYLQIRDHLIPPLFQLEYALRKKAQQWKHVLKSGRTHLRDAVPMTLGQEFNAYAESVKKDIHHLHESSLHLLTLNLGGTAIGSGVNATPHFSGLVLKELRAVTHAPFIRARNLFEGTQTLDPLLLVSGSLRVLSVNLIKIANDLRLLSSGPATGLNELSLPSVQPGSSIMPAKVNPSMAEMLDMVGFQVIGNDTTLTLCGQAGQLELNVMMPLAAHSLLQSIEILGNALAAFTVKCVMGIEANPKKCKEYLEKNPIIVTALTPYLGYAKAAEVAQQAYEQDVSVRDIVLRENLLDKKTLNKALNMHLLVGERR
ncbi:MAG: aspartate ammonia-lyase, partial [Nanoarchaeota archaeon]